VGKPDSRKGGGGQRIFTGDLGRKRRKRYSRKKVIVGREMRRRTARP